MGVIKVFPPRNFGLIGHIAVFPAEFVFREIGVIAIHNSDVKATYVSGVIDTPFRHTKMTERVPYS